MATCAGMASARTRKAKMRSRPGKRSLANAYPAIELKSSEAAVPMMATSMLLKKARPRESRVKRST
jgi:hypothetical protein